jgi:lincosamide nucleotidyltransferase A/C/D/E
MVTPDDVIHLYRVLESHSIQIWLTGGWGIDALLGENTRSHKDLDILMLVEDVKRLNDLLAKDGYSLKEYWSENQFTVDAGGNMIATGYVLHDTAGHELDVHAFRFDLHGNGIPAWEVEEGFVLTPPDLSGVGIINTTQVRCQSAQHQMLCHTGYAIPPHQWPDLEALHEKLGVEFPDSIAEQRLNHEAG